MASDLLEEDIEEIRADLKKIKEIAQHDHQMLGVLYRYHRWTRAYILLKILLIAGIIFGAYYYIEPFLEPAMKIYDKVGGGGTINALINTQNGSSGITDVFIKN